MYNVAVSCADGVRYYYAEVESPADALAFLSQYDHIGAKIYLWTEVYTSEARNPDTAQYFEETDNEKIYQQLEQSI